MHDFYFYLKTMYSLRPYQTDAVNSAILAVQKKKKNGVLVLPTGSGKSLVVASIASNLSGDTLVLQPSLEILQQNYEKMIGFGVDMRDVGIFSASAGEKNIRKITLATIGSIIKKKDEFSHFSTVIIDECHTCNAEGGMYEEMLSHLGVPVIGLSATPYRMYSGAAFQGGPLQVEAKFLHRTRPRIFSEILHITQVQEMYENKFLAPLKYDIFSGYDREKIKLNSTGLDFNDESLSAYNEEIDLVKIVKRKIREHSAKHTLVFTKFTAEAEKLACELREAKIPSAFVCGETPKKERAEILRKFKNGEISVVCNVGVLTTGFDFPALDCVILARPTMSLPLFYQMVGRGIRTAPNKDFCVLVDLCGNVDKFGKVEDFKIVGEKNLERLEGSKGFLTAVNFVTGEDLELARKKHFAKKNAEKLFEVEKGEKEVIIPFGKHIGKSVKDIPKNYLDWGSENLKGNWKEIFSAEKKRREALVK